MLDPKAVLSEHSRWGTALALAMVDSDYQTASDVDPLFWKEVQELTEDDKAALKEIFDLSVTMTPSAMVHWGRDPRFVDTVNERQKSSYMKAKTRLLEAAKMKATMSSDWSDRQWKTAQEIGFVVQSLNVSRFIDYRLWALLRTFGSRWERPNLPYLKRRPLPIGVIMEKEIALMVRQKSGSTFASP